MVLKCMKSLEKNDNFSFSILITENVNIRITHNLENAHVMCVYGKLRARRVRDPGFTFLKYLTRNVYSWMCKSLISKKSKLVINGFSEWKNVDGGMNIAIKFFLQLDWFLFEGQFPTFVDVMDSILIENWYLFWKRRGMVIKSVVQCYRGEDGWMGGRNKKQNCVDVCRTSHLWVWSSYGFWDWLGFWATDCSTLSHPQKWEHFLAVRVQPVFL